MEQLKALYEQRFGNTTTITLLSLLFLTKVLTSFLKHRKLTFQRNQLEIIRNDFLEKRQIQINLAKSLVSSVSCQKQYEIIHLSAIQIAQAIKTCKYTCEEVLLTFAYRAATIGVELNLIGDLEVENSLAEARVKDQLLATTQDKSNLPPLFGVPITVKEHLKVLGMLSCCGYLSLANKKPETMDCLFVAILRDQGAIPFAMTNVPQGLFAIETNNWIYGRSLNPHRKSLTVGGSSGGEGGAQAIRLSALGIGSDSLGSARIPAAFCGIFSFKGTGKRVSTQGRYGITATENGGFKDITTSIGPMSQHLEDLIEVEKIVLGKFNSIDQSAPPLYWNQTLFDETSLKNVKIGYMRENNSCENVPAVNNLLDEVVTKLKELGVNLVEIKCTKVKEMMASVELLMATPGIQSVINNMLKGEKLMEIHAQYFRTKNLPNWLNKLRSILLDFRGRKREAEFLHNQRTSSFIEASSESIKLEILRKEFMKNLRDESIDIIISPVMPFTAICHEDGGHLLHFIGLAGLSNILDLPAGVIPIRNVQPQEAQPSLYNDGYNDKYTNLIKETIKHSQGMPLVIQVAASPWCDEKCLKIMKEISSLFPYNNPLIQ